MNHEQKNNKQNKRYFSNANSNLNTNNNNNYNNNQDIQPKPNGPILKYINSKDLLKPNNCFFDKKEIQKLIKAKAQKYFQKNAQLIKKSPKKNPNNINSKNININIKSPSIPSTNEKEKPEKPEKSDKIEKNKCKSNRKCVDQHNDEHNLNSNNSMCDLRNKNQNNNNLVTKVRVINSANDNIKPSNNLLINNLIKKIKGGNDKMNAVKRIIPSAKINLDNNRYNSSSHNNSNSNQSSNNSSNVKVESTNSSKHKNAEIIYNYKFLEEYKHMKKRRNFSHENTKENNLKYNRKNKLLEYNNELNNINQGNIINLNLNLNNINKKKIETSNIFNEFGYSEEQNKEHRQKMEDFHMVKHNFTNVNEIFTSYFAIFDGHGGDMAALYCKDNLHNILSKCIKDNKNNIEKSLDEAFTKVDSEINSKLKEEDNEGTTATVVLITKNIVTNKRYVYCANVGDSRSYLIKNKYNNIQNNDINLKEIDDEDEVKRNLKNDLVDEALNNNEQNENLDKQNPDENLNIKNVIKLTTEHTCSDINEVDRIKKKGGLVFNGRVFGSLMITRSFGDKELKQYGVISNPSISKYEINEDEENIVVIASDGIWDVVTETNLADITKEDINAQLISENLIEMALKGGTIDNISCIVIKL